jgi:hypothetical protein
MDLNIISYNHSRIRLAIHTVRRFSNSTVVETDYKLVFRTSIPAVVLVNTSITAEGHLNRLRYLEEANR